MEFICFDVLITMSSDKLFFHLLHNFYPLILEMIPIEVRKNSIFYSIDRRRRFSYVISFSSFFSSLLQHRNVINMHIHVEKFITLFLSYAWIMFTDKTLVHLYLFDTLITSSMFSPATDQQPTSTFVVNFSFFKLQSAFHFVFFQMIRFT